MIDEDRLDLVLGALADRTRRGILARLADGDAAVGELVTMFDVTQPAISKHLKVLEHAGLISRSRRGTVRLSHLEAAPLAEVTQWLGTYRQYWDDSFDRLDDLLSRMDDHPPRKEER